MIFRLIILRSGRVDDKHKRRVTTDKGNHVEVLGLSVTVEKKWRLIM